MHSPENHIKRSFLWRYVLGSIFYHSSIHFYLTAVGTQQTSHNLKKRGLAAARWPENTYPLSLLQLKGNRMKYLLCSKSFGNAPQLQDKTQNDNLPV